MKIELYPYDYSRQTIESQTAKVNGELQELINAYDAENFAEETFDVIQSLIGLLIVMGYDIDVANNRHMDKLRKRHGGVKQ